MKEWPVRDSDADAVKNLARAIIVRSIRDVVRYREAKKPKKKRIYEECYSWMYVEEPSLKDDPLDQLMSFEGICAILGWDPSRLRERVKLLSTSDLDRLGRNGSGKGFR
jgi:hypothetical protein